MLAGKFQTIEKLKLKIFIPFIISTILLVSIQYTFQEQIFSFIQKQPPLYLSFPTLILYSSVDLIHGFLYVFGFIQLCRLPIMKNVLLILQYPGKMSLTNYISQSFICAILFLYLDYYALLKPTELILYSLIIFTFQIITSFIWLRFFQFGPLEYLWRKLTYKKL